MAIRKNTFVKKMKAFIERQQREDFAYTAMIDAGIRVEPDGFYHDMIIDLLEEALDDRFQWLSYFVYDRSGRLGVPPFVWVKTYNGKDSFVTSVKNPGEGFLPIRTSDWGDVYDLIVGDWEPSTEEEVIAEQPCCSTCLYDRMDIGVCDVPLEVRAEDDEHVCERYKPLRSEKVGSG